MKLGSFLLGSVTAVTSHNNGTGGIAPGVHQAYIKIRFLKKILNFLFLNISKFFKYLMTNGDASSSYTGADPHAVHGLVTQERIQFLRLIVIIKVK